MRTLATLATTSACALLLSACQTMPQRHGDPVPRVLPNPGAVQAHPLARSITYGCEDMTTVVLTEGQRDARATLNSGLELGLAGRGLGNAYGAPPYEFRAAGSEGVWLINGRMVRCRAK